MNQLQIHYLIYIIFAHLTLGFCLPIYTSEHQPVAVRIGHSLCDDEEAFVNKRLIHVNEALSSLLDMQIPLDKTPCIAFCGSGGGYRSMIASMGALHGFDTLGIIDTFLYSAGVSGSTWSLSSWHMYGKRPRHAVAALREQVSQNFCSGFDITPIIERSLENVITQQKIGVVGIYGALLANRFFNKLPRKYSIITSDFADQISDGSMPMPIFTAVIPPEPSSNMPYIWCEMTPFEVGFIEDSAFIPTKAFGSQFIKGLSKNKAAEYQFDFCLGICGSVFCGPLHDVLKIFSNKIPPSIYQVVDEIIIRSGNANTRFSPAQVHNFTYQLDKATYAHQEIIHLIDAGFDINLPIPAVLRPGRQVDVIIIVDASGNTINAPELLKSQLYAEKHGLKFPPIYWFNDITDRPISVFKDPNDMTAPIVIYMPVIANPDYSKTFDPIVCSHKGYCETANLQYTNDQFDELFGLTDFTVNQQANVIIQALKEAVLRKQQ